MGSLYAVEAASIRITLLMLHLWVAVRLSPIIVPTSVGRAAALSAFSNIDLVAWNTEVASDPRYSRACLASLFFGLLVGLCLNA